MYKLVESNSSSGSNSEVTAFSAITRFLEEHVSRYSRIDSWNFFV